MMPSELVTIQRYRPEYQPGVVQLILPIQNEEFGIAITAAQQPDLSDIGNFYQQGNGDFWLAQIGDRVVGCIGLKDIGQQQTALRKMFVAAPYRGREWGVASALLNTLLMYARHRGVDSIFLGTTAKFIAAHRFYEKNGFIGISLTDLPVSFPVMRVDTKFYRFTF